MALRLGESMTAHTAEGSAIGLVAATTKTVIQITSVTRPVKVTEWSTLLLMKGDILILFLTKE